MEEEIFDLNPVGIPIKMKLESGEIVTYHVKEMSGLQRDAHMVEMDKRIKAVENKSDGDQSANNLEGVQACLICLCLHDASDNLVPKDVIQKYPGKVITRLFEMSRDINALTKDSEAEVKND